MAAIVLVTKPPGLTRMAIEDGVHPDRRRSGTLAAVAVVVVVVALANFVPHFALFWPEDF